MSDAKKTEELSLNDAEVEALRKDAKELAETVSKSYFELGGKLSIISRSGCFRAWGFPTFKEYAEPEFGFKMSKVYYLIAIYEKSIDWNISRTRLDAIGWTKAGIALKAANTAEEAEEWLGRAEKMTLVALRAAVKNMADGIKAGVGEPVQAPVEEGDVDTLLPVVRSYKSEDGTRFSVCEIAFADDQYDIVKTAIALAATINTKADTTRGNLLHLIGLDFLEHNGSLDNISEKVAEWINKNLVVFENDKNPFEEADDEAA